MNHEIGCKSWPEYHFMDCPECKIRRDEQEILGGQDFTQEDLDNAYAEGEQEAESRVENKTDEAYGDGQQDVKDEIIRLLKNQYPDEPLLPDILDLIRTV